MKTYLSYKDYISTIYYSQEDDLFFGKIDGIDDLINFQGKTVSEIKTSFHEAVDDYIETSKKLGKTPQKVYLGSFNIQINPALYRIAVQVAQKNGSTLNKLVERMLEEHLPTPDDT